jgi:hypothetical protein
MIAGRPPRILLAAAALGVVGVITLALVSGPTIASLIECGPHCSVELDVSSVVLVATPFASIVLAAGLLIWPATLIRPATVASGLFAIPWIGPVGSATTLVTVVALSLLSATPFVLLTPVGLSAGRWARRLWIGTILAALVLWLLDMSFSGFMQTAPVPPQMAFLAVAAVVLGAGLASGYLHRLEGRTGR